jgi:hypothetical protein
VLHLVRAVICVLHLRNIHAVLVFAIRQLIAQLSDTLQVSLLELLLVVKRLLDKQLEMQGRGQDILHRHRIEEDKLALNMLATACFGTPILRNLNHCANSGSSPSLIVGGG